MSSYDCTYVQLRSPAEKVHLQAELRRSCQDRLGYFLLYRVVK